ncbi:ferritin-like domain-containing protein [Spongiactinospora sp. TRM90649]|uniref:ferritin-like domain-containing protein n=1 Tax=Spongiactinospora sp. TRM90649 TaxID=3031114 RepID=UPI0023FA25A7|nr:ferritin-like domain-containing protein [Spongiactinospora sp. TRM90649]MDF5752048.1 ferritin-like domain-containing protein [Spongiactinospora sp. TRM90649]
MSRADIIGGRNMSDDFVLDVQKIRQQARAKMAEGPVTDTYGKDKNRVIEILNDVIATEVVCWLRYTRHAISAVGVDRAQVAAEFTEHAKEEMNHALRAAQRVSQLGGEPDFDPAKLVQRAHTDYTAPADHDLTQMLRDNLEAERIVIDIYQEIILWLGEGDPTTRRLMESIKEEEEDHADDLLDLLGG